MPNNIPNLRAQLKIYFRDKKFKKIVKLITKEKKSKRNNKEYMEILEIIYKVIINGVQHTETNDKVYHNAELAELSNLIRKLIMLDLAYKDYAFTDMIELIFDTTIYYKQYKKIFEYFYIVTTQLSQYAKESRFPDATDIFFVSQLYKKLAEVYELNEDKDSQNKCLSLSRIYQEKSKKIKDKENPIFIESDLAKKMEDLNEVVKLSQSNDKKDESTFTDKNTEETILHYQKLGKDYLEAQDFKPALKNFTSAIDIANEKSDDRHTYLYLINLLYRGLTYSKISIPKLAANDFQNVLSHSFYNLLDDGNKEEITQLRDDIISQWIIVISIMVNAKKYDASIQYIDLYLQLYEKFNRNNLEQHNNILAFLHECYFRLHKYSQALTVVDMVSTQNIDAPHWDVLRAQIYLELNDLVKAEAALTKARQLHVQYKQKFNLSQENKLQNQIKQASILEEKKSFLDKKDVEKDINKFEKILLIKKLGQIKTELKDESSFLKQKPKIAPTFFVPMQTPKPKQPVAQISQEKKPEKSENRTQNKNTGKTHKVNHTPVSTAKNDRRAAKRAATKIKKEQALKNKEHEEQILAMKEKERVEKERKIAEQETMLREKNILHENIKSIVVGIANNVVQFSENEKAHLALMQKKLAQKDRRAAKRAAKLKQEITSAEELTIPIQSFSEQKEKPLSINNTLSQREMVRYAGLRQHIMTSEEYNEFTKIMDRLDSIQTKTIKLFGSSGMAYFMASKNLKPFRNNDIDLKIYAPLEDLQKISNILVSHGIPYTKGDVGYTHFTSKKTDQPKTERYFDITLIPKGTAEKEDFIDITKANLDVTKYTTGSHNYYYFTFNETWEILEKAFDNKVITIDLSKTNTIGFLYRMIKCSDQMKGILETQCILPDKKVITLNTRWDNADWKKWLECYFDKLNPTKKLNTTEDYFYYREIWLIIERGLVDHYKNTTIFTVFFNKLLGPCRDGINQEMQVTNLIYLFRSFFEKSTAQNLKSLIASMVTLVQEKNSKYLMDPYSIGNMIKKLVENNKKILAEKKQNTSIQSYGKMYQPAQRMMGEEITSTPTINRRI